MTQIRSGMLFIYGFFCLFVFNRQTKVPLNIQLWYFKNPHQIVQLPQANVTLFVSSSNKIFLCTLLIIWCGPNIHWDEISLHLKNKET